jgi:glycosyltransferase involved in cell wall biosynthesis
MDTKFVDIDVGRPLPMRIDVPEQSFVKAIVWLHGRPLGIVTVTCRGGHVYRRGLARAIIRQLADPILRELVRNGMATPGMQSLDLDELLKLPTVDEPVEPSQLTVVICTTGRYWEALEHCLQSLASNTVLPAAVLVVCRGHRAEPPESLCERWSAAAFPVRWLTEPSADLARARHLAVNETRTPLVAFVDELARVDAQWAAVLCRTFRNYPEAMVVTGSLLPNEVSSEASWLLAAGRERMVWRDPLAFRWLCLRPDEQMPRTWCNAHKLGSAANMAYRTSLFSTGRGFEAIAGGAAKESCQHLDLWLRVLDARLGIVHEPAAVVRGGGVPTMADVKAELRATAAGISASLVAAAVRRPRHIVSILLAAQWFVRTAIADMIIRRGSPRSLAWTRLCGHVMGTCRGFIGLLRPRSRRPFAARSAAVATTTNENDSLFAAGRIVPLELSVEGKHATDDEVSPTLEAARLTPVAEILGLWHGRVLGLVSVVTGSQPVTLEQIRRLIVDRHWDTILSRQLGLRPGIVEFESSTRTLRADLTGEAAGRVLGEHLLGSTTSDGVGASGPNQDASSATVSIVIPTRDRPDDLRECLRAIFAQETDRRAEIIVVDNHPESGLTPPVVAEFSGIRLVNEPRRGSAYARNRGLLASRGSIIVWSDDDVVAPSGWLEGLLAPFDDPTVGVVTGNIIPFQLKTSAERLCESCCSLSAGAEPFTVDGYWFQASPDSVQGWEFGTTANVAVRTSVFSDPAVGLFAESLGPGTPIGAGEDPYFFYRVLKAGYRLQYLSDVWVWHKHRSTSRHLRRQVYNYAKSAVGYHTMTLLRDGDQRSRASLFGGLQQHYLGRLVAAARGRIDVPVSLVAVEIAGHVAGGFAFAASELRRRILARDPAFPVTPPALPARPTDDYAAAVHDAAEPWALGPGSTAAAQASTAHSRGVVNAGSRRGRLPHFLVIGAQKSGTTALDVNLRKHPGIELVPHFKSSWLGWENTKETWFFNATAPRFGLTTLNDYAALFNDNNKLQGEVCPTYDRPRPIALIAEAIPDAKLILICREPVSRLESSVNHMMQWHAECPDMDDFFGWSPLRSFEANLQAELADAGSLGLLRMGLYADTVQRVLSRFPPEQLLILAAEEYRQNPQATYDRIAEFLGLRPVRINHEDAHVRNYTTRLTAEQRAWLSDFYRPHNERFFDLLGREIPSWHAARATR